MKGAPSGLLLRACMVGLVVQVVVGLLTRGMAFLVFNEGDFIPLLTAAVVMYFPIIVAANMGYKEHQLECRKDRSAPPSG